MREQHKSNMAFSPPTEAPSPQPKKSFRSFIWDTDTHLKSPEERLLLRKLDLAILTVGCLGFFLKYLDQGNLANAYVSGMQEDLSMNGNQYTYAGTAYTCAYAVMQIPSTLIIQRVRPSLFLAAMEVAWGAFTFAQAGLRSTTQLYVFRFFVGFFESSFFPCLLYVLGSWYTRTELAKRVAIFHMTAPLGTAFGGYLQAAVYENLDGHSGLAGWRWLYIVCGVSLSIYLCRRHLTLNYNLLTYEVYDCPGGICDILLPSGYTAHHACLVSDRGRARARFGPRHQSRKSSTGEDDSEDFQAGAFEMEVVCLRAGIRGEITDANHPVASVVHKLTFPVKLYGSGCQASSYFAIWLKAENYSVVDRNLIPTGTSLISAACVVLWGFLSDYTGSRFAFVVGPLVCIRTRYLATLFVILQAYNPC